MPKIHADKIIHATMFVCFAILWRRALGHGSALVIAVSGVALAVITELGQATTIVGRDGDVWDGLADTVGVLLGLAIAIRLERKRTMPEPVLLGWEGEAPAKPGTDKARQEPRPPGTSVSV